MTNGTQQELVHLSENSTTMRKNVIPYVVNKSVIDFEKSDENMIRSVMTLYRGGLISKVKYNDVRSSLMYKSDRR